MQEQELWFRSFLKRLDLRYTTERKTILEAICSINEHFDVDELYDWLKSRGLELSRATLYRAMPLFVESGLIKESLRDHGKRHYESNLSRDHHDHLICIACGKIIEFYNDQLENIQNSVCKSFKFKPIRHQLDIRGYCEDCSP